MEQQEPTSATISNSTATTATVVKPMTNEERWYYLMKDVESPEVYLKMGFYVLITSALQRRVWIPFGTNSLYPCMFVVFVGPPSVGKGRVITQVISLLKAPKRLSANRTANKVSDFLAENAKKKEMSQEELADLVDLAKKEMETVTDESSQLFVTLPDSTSMRNLTSCVAKAFRTAKYKIVDANGKLVEKIYGHSSAAFLLEELSDLFKDTKETKDVCRFLTRAWDCGDYKHETYHSGKDEIKLMCVNLLAGTTIDGMKDFFASKILNEGFSSRALFVWADKNRFYKWKTGVLDAKQQQCRHELIQYLYKLSELCGEVKLSPGADTFMQNWYENESMLPQHRVNHNYKLEHYYGRKKMHVLKLAMAIHFSESTSMILSLDSIKKAFLFLDEIERSMHIALSTRGRNELHPLGGIIAHYLRKYGRKSANELYKEFAEDLKDRQELNTLLNFLLETKQIVSVNTGGVELQYEAKVSK